MTLSNSVLHRYTPPTCSLQIVALNSPVSRRTGQSERHQVRFELSFDDPRSQHQQVNIQGNSDQLEALHEAVTTYVQNLLKSSPERFNAVFSAQAPPSLDPAVSSTPQALDLSNSQDSSSEQLLDSSPASASKEPIAARGKIFLQPGTGILHNLFLGPLASKESGPVIQLSMLQLFDLATALDAYAADRVVVPVVPGLSRSMPTAGPSAWAGIAAVLLVGVGLTTAVLTLNRSDDRQQTVNKNATGSSTKEQQPIALQPSSLPTLGASPPPLSSPESLPSFPPLGSIVPSPSPSTPTAIAPQTPLALPSAPPARAPQTPLVISGAPPLAPDPTPVIPIPRITPGSPILINPIPRQDSSVSIPGEATTPTTNGVQPPIPVAPPSIAIPSPSLQLTPPNSKLEAALSETSGKPTAQQSPNSAQTQSRSTSATSNEPKDTAFNNIPPQVAEARDYFNQRWEPPTSLRQTLEYSLVLDVDGTIQRIEPLGQAARNYVDRTGMPLIGERFVSGNKNGQNPRIRVVLAPDGKVQTFLEEYANQPKPPRRPNKIGTQPRVLSSPAP